MNQNLKDKIIADIKETGFPAELEVAQVLHSFRWDIEQNGTYLDYEFNKSREIDIKARKLFSHSLTRTITFHIAINLIVEIKKSFKRPWIVFTVPNKKPKHYGFMGPAFAQLTHSDNFTTDLLSPQDFMKEFPRNKEKSIGTSFYEAFKSPDEPSKIYEAIMSSIKAAFYARILESGEDVLTENQIQEINSRTYEKTTSTALEVYMPLIIFDGILCEAKLNQKNEIELSESKYIPLEISHSVKPYSDHFNYYPELIHLTFLQDFLTKLEIWGNSLIELWKK